MKHQHRSTVKQWWNPWLSSQCSLFYVSISGPAFLKSSCIRMPYTMVLYILC